MTALIVIISIPFICLSVFIGIFISKKVYAKTPFYIIGWRKKNRAVLRDERLIPMFIKTNVWKLWLIADICTIPMLLYVAIATNEWLLAIAILAAGIVISIIIAILWRKSWADFIKLKNELGIVLEPYDDTIKTEFANIKKIQIKASVFVTLLSAVLSVINIIQNNLFTGIVYAVLGIINSIILVTYFIKEKDRNI